MCARAIKHKTTYALLAVLSNKRCISKGPRGVDLIISISVLCISPGRLPPKSRHDLECWLQLP